MNEAQQWIETAENSDSVPEIMKYAKCLFLAGYYSTALRYMAKAKEMNETLANIHFVVATDDRRRMIEHQALCKTAWQKYANSRQALDRGDLDLAINVMKEAVQIAPNDAALNSSLGFFFWKKYEREADARSPTREHSSILGEAERTIAHAMELDPCLAEAHNNMGMVHVCARRAKDARVCYLRALELKPDYGDAQRNLAMLREYAGNELD